MRIIIIEDEPFTAEDLADYIVELRPTWTVQQILPSVKSAVQYLKNHQDYDLIFSDIQLGDGNCFDIYNTITIQKPIIFCTAYDEYALDAFQVNGIAYVLKPFTKENIEKALKKYQQLQQEVQSTQETPQTQIEKLLATLGQQQSTKNSGNLLVHQGDKIIPIRMEDVALCRIHHNLVQIITLDRQKFIVNPSLDDLEKLGGQAFFRANRQFLVNRKVVKEASQYFKRKLLVHLTIPFDEQITISKEKVTSFLNWLVEA